MNKRKRRRQEKKIVIFEPHIDDALLSCHSKLISKHFSKIYIVSFCSGDLRNSLVYKTKINPRIIPVILPLSEVHYKYANEFNLKDFLEGRLYNRIGYRMLKKQFSDYFLILARISEDTGEQYIPYGIYHPHHIIVNHLLKVFFRSLSLVGHVSYFIDQPYCFNHPDALKAAHSRNEIDDYAKRIQVVQIHNPDLKNMMINCFDSFFLTGYEDKIISSMYILQ